MSGSLERSTTTVPEHPVDGLQSACEEIRPLLNDQRRRNLAYYHGVGLIIGRQYDAIAAQLAARAPSQQAFYQQLEEAMGLRAGLLSDLHRLAQTYTLEAIAELARHPHVSLAHILKLAGLNGVLRAQLQARMLIGRWNLRQLDRAIRAAVGPKRRRSKSGPLASVPRNVRDALNHLLSVNRQTISLQEATWFGRRFDLPRAIAELPADQLDGQLRALTAEAADVLDRLAKISEANAEALRQTVALIDSRCPSATEYKPEPPAKTQRRGRVGV